MNWVKILSRGGRFVRPDVGGRPPLPGTRAWAVASRAFSHRNPENTYPVCGPIRARLGTDEPHPSEAKNLAQRLEEMRVARSPQQRHDIGLPETAASAVSRKERLDLESERRKRQSSVSDDFDPLSAENRSLLTREWMRSSGLDQLKVIGEHYGIFRDLFGEEYFFYPRIPWKISYPGGAGISAEDGIETANPVFFGNYLKPSDVTKAPEISIETSDPESLWCVLMTSPDGHFTHENSEYVHYLIGNIKGSDVATGEVLSPYLQPFPPKGTGYHRYVFLLFKQDEPIDFSRWRVKNDGINLAERTFSTLDFYAELQDKMTPASFAFFQASYDRSLRRFFHEKLGMREPVYEYEFPEPNYRPQVRYPIGRPFNYYLDRYKHPQQVNKEVLLLRLKDLHPFEGEPKPLKFPLAHKTPWNMPSWVKQDLADRAMKERKYKDL